MHELVYEETTFKTKFPNAPITSDRKIWMVTGPLGLIVLQEFILDDMPEFVKEKIGPIGSLDHHSFRRTDGMHNEECLWANGRPCWFDGTSLVDKILALFNAPDTTVEIKQAFLATYYTEWLEEADEEISVSSAHWDEEP